MKEVSLQEPLSEGKERSLRKPLTFAEMFRGIGGFRLGLERSGWKCVWSNDIDKYSTKVYRGHFGGENDFEGDIREVDARTIPDHALLTAGFPCQSFSLAGKRKGFQDIRGTLFHEIVRIARTKRPKLLLLENVKGLLSNDNGKTFGTILEELGNIGYWLEWQTLNSKHYGVPQNRERVFIIGHLRGASTRQIFPIRQNGSEYNKKQIQGNETTSTIRSTYYKNPQRGSYIAGSLTGGGHSGGLHSQTTMIQEDGSENLIQIGNLYENEADAGRVYSSDGIVRTLKGEAGGLGGKTGLYVQACLTPDRIRKRQHGRRFKDNGEEMFTLTGQDIHGIAIFDRQSKKIRQECGCLRSTGTHGRTGFDVILTDGHPDGKQRTCLREGRVLDLTLNGTKIRRLTPIECERLQGFPDGWTEGVSDTQRYKLLGNAVTVNVVEFLGKELREALEQLLVEGEAKTT